MKAAEKLPGSSRAAVLTAQGRPLQFMDLRLPPLASGQVLVCMAYSGICRSQLNEIDGLKGPDPYIPHTLGHEGAGTVLAVAADVQKLRPGQRVIATWIRGAGRDAPSTRYGSDAGVVNSGAVSTFLTHAVIAENRLVPCPAGMAMDVAALLGCAVPTGAGIVRNSMGLRAGQGIVVFGAGGIGLSAVLMAAMSGAAPLIVVDTVAEKRAAARRFGASHVVDPADGDVAAQIAAICPQGVDFALEATGQADVMALAHGIVRPGGGLCVLAGNPPAGARVALDPYDLIQGRRIMGSWGGETDPDRDIPVYAAAFREGRLPIDRLISARYPFGEINTALEDMRQGRVLRAMIDLGGEAAFTAD